MLCLLWYFLRLRFKSFTLWGVTRVRQVDILRFPAIPKHTCASSTKQLREVYCMSCASLLLASPAVCLHRDYIYRAAIFVWVYTHGRPSWLPRVRSPHVNRSLSFADDVMQMTPCLVTCTGNLFAALFDGYPAPHAHATATTPPHLSPHPRTTQHFSATSHNPSPSTARTGVIFLSGERPER